MAEIRSTFDLVMERAARMEAEAGNQASNEEIMQKGMKKAAAYMRGEDIDLITTLKNSSKQEKTFILKGIVQAFLRNVTLPRHESDLDNSNRAMQGLVELGQGGGDLLSMFSDIKSILDRYIEHKKQLKKQLEEQFSQQMALMEQNLAQQTGVSMKLEPSQHPKFAEEWLKLQTQLNEQYGEALKQYKNQVSQRLASFV